MDKVLCDGCGYMVEGLEHDAALGMTACPDCIDEAWYDEEMAEEEAALAAIAEDEWDEGLLAALYDEEEDEWEFEVG